MQAVQTESPGPSPQFPAWSTTGWEEVSPPLGSSDSSPGSSRPQTPASPPPVEPRPTAGPLATEPSAAARRATREIPTLAARLTPALSLPVETTPSANEMVRRNNQDMFSLNYTDTDNIKTSDIMSFDILVLTERCIVYLFKYFLFSLFPFLW